MKQKESSACNANRSISGQHMKFYDFIVFTHSVKQWYCFMYLRKKLFLYKPTEGCDNK